MLGSLPATVKSSQPPTAWSKIALGAEGGPAGSDSDTGRLTQQNSVQARQQLGSAGGSQLLAPVPSGSYIAFSQSKELGSGLQKMQRLRSKASQAAWQGLPTPNAVRSLPARMSSRRARRLDSVLRRFGDASFAAPAEVRPRLRWPAEPPGLRHGLQQSLMASSPVMRIAKRAACRDA